MNEVELRKIYRGELPPRSELRVKQFRYDAAGGTTFAGDEGSPLVTVLRTDPPQITLPVADLSEFAERVGLDSLFCGELTVPGLARVCHEANRALCAVYGDFSQRPWALAEEWQRASAIDGVTFALDNPTAPPDRQHQKWMADKFADGWVYGETKDADAKTHPCLVPYDELPPFQQAKDHLFQGIVRSLAQFVVHPETETAPESPAEPERIVDTRNVELIEDFEPTVKADEYREADESRPDGGAVGEPAASETVSQPAAGSEPVEYERQGIDAAAPYDPGDDARTLRNSQPGPEEDDAVSAAARRLHGRRDVSEAAAAE